MHFHWFLEGFNIKTLIGFSQTCTGVFGHRKRCSDSAWLYVWEFSQYNIDIMQIWIHQTSASDKHEIFEVININIRLHLLDDVLKQAVATQEQQQIQVQF